MKAYKYDISYGRQLTVKDEPHRTQETIRSVPGCIESKAESLGNVINIAACQADESIELEAISVGEDEAILIS